VSELTDGLDAATPLNFTEVTPVKPLPVMVTEVPGEPDVGLKNVMIGGAATTVTVVVVLVTVVPEDEAVAFRL
jgi:hypothetical protein